MAVGGKGYLQWLVFVFVFVFVCFSRGGRKGYLQWLVLVLVLSWGSLTMACQQVYKGGKVARGIHNGLSTSLQSQAAELTSMFHIPCVWWIRLEEIRFLHKIISLGKKNPNFELRYTGLRSIFDIPMCWIFAQQIFWGMKHFCHHTSSYLISQKVEDPFEEENILYFVSKCAEFLHNKSFEEWKIFVNLLYLILNP